MADPSAKQWLDQAKSDLDCAAWRIVPEDAVTYCHAIAKYQQAVEEAVKGLIVALKLMEPTRDHEVIEEMKTLTFFSDNSRGRSNKNFRGNVSQLMNSQNRNTIGILVRLSPKYPEVGELARRNTEYPFQDAQANWKIPSDKDVFSKEKLDQFRQTA